MINVLLYLTTIFIWGSTWLAMKFQVAGEVSPIWSVAYRFGFAAMILLGICFATGRSLRFTVTQHRNIALQGIFLFSLLYVLFYTVTEKLVSGLAAIIFGSLAIMNSLNASFLFKKPLIPRVLLGCVMGLVGLIFVYLKEVKLASNVDLYYYLTAPALGIIGTYCGSLGNMVSMINQRNRIPILQTNALAMTYGSLFTVLLAFICKAKITVSYSPSYILSFAYLVIVGSILGFGCYLKLLGRVGPERAGYTSVFIPIVALLFSTLFEEFNWHLTTFIGLLLMVCGNIVILSSKNSYQKRSIEVLVNESPA